MPSIVSIFFRSIPWLLIYNHRFILPALLVCNLLSPIFGGHALPMRSVTQIPPFSGYNMSEHRSSCIMANVRHRTEERFLLLRRCINPTIKMVGNKVSSTTHHELGFHHVMFFKPQTSLLNQPYCMRQIPNYHQLVHSRCYNIRSQ